MKTNKRTPRIETLEDRNMLSASPLGGLTAPAPEPTHIGLLVPAVQKVREAAATVANGMEILGIAWGGPTMIMGSLHMSAGTQEAMVQKVREAAATVANGMEILGIAWGGPTMIMGSLHMSAGTQEAMLDVEGGASDAAGVGRSPMLQGATNGTLGPQQGDATVVQGVNTAHTVRVNNLANLEALLNKDSGTINQQNKFDLTVTMKEVMISSWQSGATEAGHGGGAGKVSYSDLSIASADGSTAGDYDSDGSISADDFIFTSYLTIKLKDSLITSAQDDGTTEASSGMSAGKVSYSDLSFAPAADPVTIKVEMKDLLISGAQNGRDYFLLLEGKL